MGTQGYSYQSVRKKLMPQLKRCRDRELRIKAELILEAFRIEDIVEACRRAGFGRSFFYKWWSRLVAHNFRITALRERSRRPKKSPRKIAATIESRIGSYHRKGYGADMIREFLRREGLAPVSKSTIHHVVNRRKPPHKKRRFKLKKHRRRYELVIPGQRLQVDVKYSPMLVGGKVVYVYVAVDECTRWRFSWAYPELNEQWTVDFLDRLKGACPFPIGCIQTDNGWEFTFALHPFQTRAHAMDLWCRHHGISHRLIPPGVKELNGKVERSHRIDAEYFYGRAPTANLERLNRALSRWIRFYNVQRPHGGLGYGTPMEKLKERMTALKTEVVDAALEPLRQKFLRDGPKPMMPEAEQLLLAFDLGKDPRNLKKAS